MRQKRKKVLCVDSDPSFLDLQKKTLTHKKIGHCFFGFNDFGDAIHFIEKQVIPHNEKLDYILLDQKILGKELLPSLEKISGLKNFLKKSEIIVCTNENNNALRNQVMQYPFVSAFLVKPIPSNYIEFLITGQSD